LPEVSQILTTGVRIEFVLLCVLLFHSVCIHAGVKEIGDFFSFVAFSPYLYVCMFLSLLPLVG